MAKSSKKSIEKNKKKNERGVERSAPSHVLLDDDLSAALDVVGGALEMIGRIAGEAAGRLRALAEVHRRRAAKDDEE
jgi:hypothetical protein